MSSKKKKILSALLASSMLVSQVSVVAFAATEPMLENFTYTAPTGADEEGNYTYDGTAKEASIVWNGVETSDTITVKYTESSTGENLSTTAPSDAGTYYVYAVVEDGSDYSNTPVQVGSFTIKKAAPSLSDFVYEPYDPPYNQTWAAVVSPKEGMGKLTTHYYDENGEEVVDKAPPVGSYTATVTAEEGTNYLATTSEITDPSWKFTVKPFEVDAVSLTNLPDTLEAGGTPATTFTTGADTYTVEKVEWVYIDEDEKTLGESEPFAPNTVYTAKITLAPASENYKFASEVTATGFKTENVAPNAETGKIVIEKMFPATDKVAAKLTKPPVAVPKLKYTGEPQALVTAGEAEGGTIQYRLGSTGDYGTTIPEATNVGTYTVYYMVKGDETHSNVGADSFEVTIAKADVTLDAPTASAIEYGKTLADSTLSDDWNWTSSETKPNVANEGFEAYLDVSATDGNYDYAAFAEANEGYTYSSSEHKLKKTVAVTVNPKEIEIIIETSADEFTYTNEAKTFTTVTVKESGNEENILTVTTDYTISYENNTAAGDNATLIITAAENGNYTFTGTTTKTFSIAQAEPAITVTAEQKIVKSTGTFTAPTADVSGKFTFVYDGMVYDEKGIPALETAIKAAESGTISYGFTPDNENYKYVNGTINFTVVDLKFTVGGEDISETKPAVTEVAENCVYGNEWSDMITINVNGAAIGDTSSADAKFTLDVSGKPNVGEQTYKVLFNGTINEQKYENVVVYTGTVTVAPKPVTVSAGTKAKISKVYDGTSDVNTKICKFDEDFVINGLEVADKDKVSVEIYGIGTGGFGTSDVTDTAKVIVGVKLKGEAAGNYKLGEYGTAGVDVPGEITQRTITPTATVSGTYTYTGSVVTPGNDKVVVKFTDKDFMGGAEQTLELTTDYTFVGNTTNAGKATITISPVASSNYTFTKIEKTFTIKPKKVETLNVEVTGNYSYTGSAITPTFTVKDGETALAASDYVVTITDNINAGTGKVTITAKSGGNYTFAETTADFTIAKAASLSVADTNVYFKTDATGEQTVQLVLPESVGAVDYTSESTKVVISSNENTVIAADSASISADGVKFTLGDNASNSGKTATITATLVTANYEAVTAKVVVTINEKENQEAPKCELTFSTADDTITATIAKIDGAVYSFDGKTWDSSTNTKTVAPNTVVTAYIKYPARTIEDVEYNESPVASVTKTSPSLKAATPTITAGTTFTESQEVTISCTTEGAEIFYTTDGTAPSASNGTKYTGAFTITTTTTVKAIAIKSGYTNSDVVSATYTKKSTTPSNPGGSGGSGGGSSSGGSSSTSTPSIDGKETTWTDVAKDISKLTEDKTQTIDLNGSTTVPVEVVKAIATSNAEVTLKVDDVFSWTIDGSDIDAKDAKAANLSITKATVTGTSALRGTVGTGFTIKGTNVKSELNINFKATNAGKFANLFKKVDGKLVFVDNVKVDKNGAAIGLEVSEKGEYVVMLGKYSDRAGDMDNDGIMNTKDSLAILKDFLDIESGENPVVADINGDGYINAKDALEVLIAFLNLK